MKLVEPGIALDQGRLYASFFDDFFFFTDTDDLWTVTSDAGAIDTTDAAGGILSAATTGVDNNETYVHTTHEIALIAAGKPLRVESRLTWTEANTDDANVIFGVCEAAGADALVDNGAGPAADYSGAVFYKIDGETTWRVEYSDGTTKKQATLDADGALDGVAHTCGAGTYQTLAIEIRPITATKCDVLFWIDGVNVAAFKDQTYASAAAAEVIAGIKAGGANAETLLVDYIGFSQLR